MMKLVGLGGLLALSIFPVIAQDQPAPDQNAPVQVPAPPQAPARPPVPPKTVKRTLTVPKYQISGGYTHRSFYAPNGVTLGMNGYYAGFDYTFLRWISLEGEFTSVWKDQGFLLGTTHINTIMVGPDIFPLGHRKLTPFGHVLFGGGHYSNSVPTFQAYPGSTVSSTVTSWEVGGGLDMAVSPHWGIRLVEGDFVTSHFYADTVNYSSRGSVRLSFGIVYRWGEK